MMRYNRWLSLTVLCMALCSCGGTKDESTAETPSQGELTVYCDDAVMPLMRVEAAAYDSIFPKVRITLIPIDARSAVVKLLSGETKLAVLSRRLLDDERALVTKYNVQYGEYEIARDALAIIVNRRNPIDTASVPTLNALFSGRITQWSVVRKDFTRPVNTVVPNATAGSYSHLIEGITGAAIATADNVCDSASQIVAAVRANEGAIGAVDWNMVWNDTTVRVLRVAGIDSTGQVGRYMLLHPAYIHLKSYPLRHSMYGYTTEGHPALAKGFMAFVCNADGQRLALAQGLVPATQIIHLREPD